MEAPLHYRILNAVHERVQALDLTDLPATQIYRRKLSVDRDVTLPCVIVALGDRETVYEDAESFEDASIGYPVTISHVEAANQDMTVEATALSLVWRERILRCWLDDYLAGLEDVPEAYDTRVEPGAVCEQTLWRESNIWVGWVTLRVITTHSKGRGE